MNIPEIKNILITGCGGDIAISIARILRELMNDVKLIGTDIYEDHPAVAFFDEVISIVRADNKAYKDMLGEIINDFNIELIIPSTEAEIKLLVERGDVDSIFNVPVLMANKCIVEVGLNKLETAKFLKSSGIISPWTILVGEGKPIEYPCIIKPVSGCGSKNISVVEEASFSSYSAYGNDFIWQEYLYPDNEEYTCGLYRSSSGEVRTIIIKRELQGGLTGKGLIVKNESISQILEDLALSTLLEGSVNVQLRLTKQGPVIFEINPRFSSTVMFRHKLGFKDLQWAIEDKFNMEVSEYKAPKAGTRFYRVANEVIL